MELNKVLNTLEVKDIVETISILIIFLLGILSTMILVGNSRKLKKWKAFSQWA